MAIIRHNEVEQTRGHFSRILNRRLVVKQDGPSSFELWEQIIPSRGYIVAHSHGYTEILVFLSGRAEIDLDGTSREVEADSTVVLEPGVVHSVRNLSEAPVHLLAFHTQKATLQYPGTSPDPVDWSRS